MGRWDDSKGGLAHRERIREEHWSGEVGTARSATLCRIEYEASAFGVELAH